MGSPAPRATLRQLAGRLGQRMTFGLKRDSFAATDARQATAAQCQGPQAAAARGRRGATAKGESVGWRSRFRSRPKVPLELVSLTEAIDKALPNVPRSARTAADPELTTARADAMRDIRSELSRLELQVLKPARIEAEGHLGGIGQFCVNVLPKLGMGSALLLSLTHVTGLPFLATLGVVVATVVVAVTVATVVQWYTARQAYRQHPELAHLRAQIETIHTFLAESDTLRELVDEEVRQDIIKEARRTIDVMRMKPMYVIGLAAANATLPIMSLGKVLWYGIQNYPPGTWIINFMVNKGLMWEPLPPIRRP